MAEGRITSGGGNCWSDSGVRRIQSIGKDRDDFAHERVSYAKSALFCGFRGESGGRLSSACARWPSLLPPEFELAPIGNKALPCGVFLGEDARHQPSTFN